MKLIIKNSRLFDSRLQAVRFFLLTATVVLGLLAIAYYQKTRQLSQQTTQVQAQLDDAKGNLDKTANELQILKNQDQYQTNLELATEINEINKTYKQAVTIYERLLEARDKVKKTDG